MPSVKRWLWRMVKVGALAGLVVMVAGGAWWLSRPEAGPRDLELREERLIRPADRVAADSALGMIAGVARELGLPSVSVAVGVEGEVVWAAALGTADLAGGRGASLRTVYRAGSVSKSMTGLAVAELVERGALDLDASVHRYLPGYPVKRWAVTPGHLGAHTGGVRHYAGPGEPGFFAEQLSKRRYGSVDEALSIFSGDSLLFEPGTGFQYSTHGFTLLSAVAESAAGVPFLALLERELWTPLGMQDTRPDDLSVVDSMRAVPYVALGGRLLHVEGADPSYKWAGGGILTTPTDLVRMGNGLLSGRLIADSLRAALLTPRPLADGSPNPQRYALGWRNGAEAELLGSTDTLDVLHHGGASPGGSSFLLLIPEGRGVVAVMTNLSLGDPRRLRSVAYRALGLFRTTGSGR